MPCDLRDGAFAFLFSSTTTTTKAYHHISYRAELYYQETGRKRLPARKGPPRRVCSGALPNENTRLPRPRSPSLRKGRRQPIRALRRHPILGQAPSQTHLHPRMTSSHLANSSDPQLDELLPAEKWFLKGYFEGLKSQGFAVTMDLV